MKKTHMYVVYEGIHARRGTCGSELNFGFVLVN